MFIRTTVAAAPEVVASHALHQVARLVEHAFTEFFGTQRISCYVAYGEAEDFVLYRAAKVLAEDAARIVVAVSRTLSLCAWVSDTPRLFHIFVFVL